MLIVFRKATLETPWDFQDNVDVLYTIEKSYPSKVWPYHVRSDDDQHYSKYTMHCKRNKSINRCHKSENLSDTDEDIHDNPEGITFSLTHH